MTAREWDHFDNLERLYDPEAFKQRKDQWKRDSAMKYAAEILSIEDLETLLEKKRQEMYREILTR